PEQARFLYERRVAEAGLEQPYQTAQEGGEESLSVFVGAHAAELGNPTERPQGTPELGAPQAGALEAAINIVRSGDVPLGKYLTGAVLGILVSLLVSPGLGVMVGLSMYLPFEYMIVFGIGGILSILASRIKGARWAEDWGVPLAAGLIVGDAIVGVIHAIVKVSFSLGGAA
ncbi:MAG: OPT/YSL family transporter, partial [Planctomycetota bacterium]